MAQSSGAFMGGIGGFVLGAGLAVVICLGLVDKPEEVPLPVEGGDTPAVVPVEPIGPGATGKSSSTIEKEKPTGGEDEAPSAAVNKLMQENRRLNEELVTLRSEMQGMVKPPVRVPHVFRFGITRKTPVFNKADWKVLGHHMTELARVIPDLAKAIGKGRRPSDKVMKLIGKHNSPLAMFAMAANEELGGAGPNGAYTHPAVMSNLIRSALLGVEEPLTEDQEASIRALGNAWGSEETRRMASYTEKTLPLAKTVDEVDGKLRFLNSVKDVLSVRQREFLFHPQTEGRAQLDLLSPALVYVMRDPILADTREDLEKRLLEKLGAAAGSGKEVDAEPFVWVTRQWIDDMPTALKPVTPGSPDHVFPHVDDIQEAARAQVAAMERIIAMGQLTPEQTQNLRAVTTVLMPRLKMTTPVDEKEEEEE